MLNNIRIEEDLLGTREVPADAYYGVHTLRAIENFYISNSKISDIPEFVRGMVMVKKAAALANKELQTIPKSAANAIIAACDEVLNNGKCMDQFPVDVYQGGAGTSVNMNTNEVLANIGLELMGHQKGEYQYLNPNDHVNKCQSTNDAYPSAIHLGLYATHLELRRHLEALIAAYDEGAEWLDALNEYLHGNYRFLREYFDRNLPQYPVLPLEGTYLVWVDCRASGLTSDELETKLLEEAKLRINPGAIYGEAGRDFIRLNIACPRKLLAEGLDRLRKVLKR